MIGYTPIFRILLPTILNSTASQPFPNCIQVHYITSICRKPCYDHLASKKVKNISLNSLVVNTDRPIVSKTHRLEESLNDANRSFENNKECSNDISISSETLVAKP